MSGRPCQCPVASFAVGMGLVNCGPAQDFDLGEEGYWAVECAIDNGAGATVLVRFDGRRVADSEVIV